MELGEKLKQARLEAGLSQRQLCGDTITRNMLSQIENGSAQPSLATLRVLCDRLGKPISYFREDTLSENLSLLHKASGQAPAEALAMLKAYRSPDPMLDPWYHALSSQCLLALSAQALEEGRPGYASTLLHQAAEHGADSGAFQRRYVLLRFRSGEANLSALAEALPDNTEEMHLRAHAALLEKNWSKCLACIAAADRQTEAMQLLRGDALMGQGDYAHAAECFLPLKGSAPLYARLEVCYRELGDYQKAYEYACKQR